MSNSNVHNILEQCNIPEVRDRKYWLVRTDSGAHYEDFAINGYIAIGWDYISSESFRLKQEEEIKSIIFSQEKSSPTNGNDDEQDGRNIGSRVTSIYNKLKRFICEFSIGDVIIIPNKNTEQISIGVITGEVSEDPDYAARYLSENPETEIGLCPYKKRRTVEWNRSIQKAHIDVFLIKAFSSHHAISDISDYADYINRELYSMYLANDKIHTIIRAGHPNGLNFGELRALIDVLESTISESAELAGVHCDTSQIQVKLNIHSPGIIEFVAAAGGLGVAIAIGMLCWNHIMNGGKMKIALKVCDVLDFSAETESLGVEGRKNQLKQIESESRIKEIALSGEQRIRELTHRLEITVPGICSKEDVLNIEPADSVDCSK